MKCMLAIFADAELRTDEVVAAWRAYAQAMKQAGVFVEGSRLRSPSTATTVRLETGRRRVQDGPFANTKEQLGGYLILNVPSLDEAVDWAARCPAVDYGAIEVRPILVTD